MSIGRHDDGTPPGARPRQALRRGGADAPVLVVALGAILVAVAVAALFVGQGTTVEELQPAPSARPSTGTPGELASVPSAPVAQASASGLDLGVDSGWKELGKSYDGTCTISGFVEMDGDIPFPDRWTLVIEPSRFSVGNEHATRRVVEFDGNVRTFEETDLPMGGYSVSVKAPGLNSANQEVLLFKVEGHEHLAGKDRAHLMLILTGAGFLDGSVRDAAGMPVEGLPVVLEKRDTRVRTTTTTAPSGIYRFDDVLDGSYTLFLGDPNRPLIPGEEITFESPQHRHPDQEIPVTASVRFVTTDAQGQALGQVRVRGFGGEGGSVDVATDGDGQALVRFLPAGDYKVHATDETGRRALGLFTLEGDEVEHVVELTCQRP